jgi:hypothetical protein
LASVEDHRANAIARLDPSGEHEVFDQEVIPRELVKTFRANGYLLLYNLVESTMTGAIDAIHRSFLGDADCRYDNLSSALKKIVLSNFKKAIGNRAYASEAHALHPIERAVLEWGYDKEGLFSGNLDARAIRDEAARYGFSIVQTDWQNTRHGERLLNVKNKRNELAHGKVSFEDCGHEISRDELVDISNETIAYLDSVLQGVELYLNDKKYLNAG